MIVDSSALMAIVLKEPGHEVFITALYRNGGGSIAAGSWVEMSAVLTRSRRSHLFVALDALVAGMHVAIEPMSVNQSIVAHQAYRSFGIGTGHPAALNFGDCFAYALSKDTGRPLLFKGDDFARTDITPAV